MKARQRSGQCFTVAFAPQSMPIRGVWLRLACHTLRLQCKGRLCWPASSEQPPATGCAGIARHCAFSREAAMLPWSGVREESCTGRGACQRKPPCLPYGLRLHLGEGLSWPRVRRLSWQSRQEFCCLAMRRGAAKRGCFIATAAKTVAFAEANADSRCCRAPGRVPAPVVSKQG